LLTDLNDRREEELDEKNKREQLGIGKFDEREIGSFFTWENHDSKLPPPTTPIQNCFTTQTEVLEGEPDRKNKMRTTWGLENLGKREIGKNLARKSTTAEHSYQPP